MIIQIGTDVDESRILWKYKESDEWKRADIDDLIRAYEQVRFGEKEMSKEEAIKILKNPPSTYDEKMWEALDIAIKSLSSDTTEVVHCKDCINRGDIFHCPIDDTYTVNDNEYCSYGVKKLDLGIDHDTIQI